MNSGLAAVALQALECIGPCAIFDASGAMVYRNREWANQPSGSSISLLGSLFSCATPSAPPQASGFSLSDVHTIYSGYRDIRDGREPRFEYRLPSGKGGSVHWFLLRITPVPFGGQRMVLVRVRDITDRHQAEGELREKIDQLHMIQGALDSFNGSRLVEEHLQKLEEVLPGYLGVGRVTLLVYDYSVNALVAGHFLGIQQTSSLPPSPPQPVGFSVSGVCFNKGESVVIQDCAKSDLIPREYVQQLGLKSVAAVPLLAGRRVLGVLRADKLEQADGFSEHEVAFLEFLGEQVGLLIQNARLFEEHRRGIAELWDSERRYTLARRLAEEGPWEWDLQTGELFCSDRFREILEFQGHAFPRKASELLDMLHPADRDLLESSIQEHLSGDTPRFEWEVRVRRPSKDWHWVLVRGVALRDEEGKPFRLAGNLMDIHARKCAETERLRSALHDAMTGLPNRAWFMEHLESALGEARSRPEALLAVLFLDVDRFKLVNESLGHGGGDELLTALSRRIVSSIPRDSVFARFGSDEFVLLLENLPEPREAEAVAGRIQDVLSYPFAISGKEFFVSLSGGICLGPSAGNGAEEMVRNASLAMNRAKSQGRSRFQVFADSMRAGVSETLEIETELRRAIDRDELHLEYQPIINLAEGRLAGFESLVRWNHARRGHLMPGQFIPMAEENGLIVPLGWWTVRRACRQMRFWQQKYPSMPGMFVSVNLSPRQFAEPDLVQRLAGILEEAGLPASCLALEITETTIMQNAETIVHLLTSLKQLGVQLLVDDFGTGYSSLSYLQKFPIDHLKVDRSFVHGISDDPGKMEIVRAVITLARSLGMGVIAEGAENESDARLLHSLGCDMGQGYYYGHPATSENTETCVLETAFP